jgi:hypothetical protein
VQPFRAIWAFENDEKENIKLTYIHVVIKAFHVLCFPELLIFIFLLNPRQISSIDVSFKAGKVRGGGKLVRGRAA